MAKRTPAELRSCREQLGISVVGGDENSWMEVYRVSGKQGHILQENSGPDGCGEL